MSDKCQTSQTQVTRFLTFDTLFGSSPGSSFGKSTIMVVTAHTVSLYFTSKLKLPTYLIFVYVNTKLLFSKWNTQYIFEFSDSTLKIRASLI